MPSEARFIPGGRTAATLAAGTLGMPWRRFIAFDVVAGAFWSNYAALLGYFGGKAFENEPLKGFPRRLRDRARDRRCRRDLPVASQARTPG